MSGLRSVVLLHGLGRNSQIMAKMAEQLTADGYRVLNLEYPSTLYPITELVDWIAPQIQAFNIDTNYSLYFVGHSLGSLITHFFIKKYRPPNLNRVVALGPPYQGSAIVDHLSQYNWYKKIYGPAALELTTRAEGICHRLGRVDYELGVIAGDRWYFLDWFFAKYWLKQPNDGKVAVASTRIEGCRDHIVLPVNHVFFPTFPEVLQQTAYFLDHGTFAREIDHT